MSTDKLAAWLTRKEVFIARKLIDDDGFAFFRNFDDEEEEADEYISGCCELVHGYKVGFVDFNWLIIVNGCGLCKEAENPSQSEFKKLKNTLRWYSSQWEKSEGKRYKQLGIF